MISSTDAFAERTFELGHWTIPAGIPMFLQHSSQTTSASSMWLMVLLMAVRGFAARVQTLTTEQASLGGVAVLSSWALVPPGLGDGRRADAVQHCRSILSAIHGRGMRLRSSFGVILKNLNQSDYFIIIIPN